MDPQLAEAIDIQLQQVEFATRADELAQQSLGETSVSYTHLRAHETVLDLVCRLLLEKKNTHQPITYALIQYQNTYITHDTNKSNNITM